MTSRVRARAAAAAIFGLTVVQLLVATAFPDLQQFAGKGFRARLIAYPVAMLAPPVIWWAVARRRGREHAGDVGRDVGRDVGAALPWAGFALIMAPFLIDVTGNTLNLYDTVRHWDDVNHYVNWFLLCSGGGLLLQRGPRRPGPEFVLLVGGMGAILAIGWEIAEYFSFIRGGTELAGAYTDTLGDETLGTLGALCAGLILTRWQPAPEGAPGPERVPRTAG